MSVLREGGSTEVFKMQARLLLFKAMSSSRLADAQICMRKILERLYRCCGCINFLIYSFFRERTIPFFNRSILKKMLLIRNDYKHRNQSLLCIFPFLLIVKRTQFILI